MKQKLSDNSCVTFCAKVTIHDTRIIKNVLTLCCKLLESFDIKKFKFWYVLA